MAGLSTLALRILLCCGALMYRGPRAVGHGLNVRAACALRGVRLLPQHLPAHS